MKARIRRISGSVDTALSPTSATSSSDACLNAVAADQFNSSQEISHGYNNNPSSKSLDICVPESRIERMRKLLSSPLLKRKTASQHGQLCSHHHQQSQQHQLQQQQQQQQLHHHHHHHHHQQHHQQNYYHHHQQHHTITKQLPPPSSSSSSSPSSSPALGVQCASQASSMKTFGVSLESLSHHQHPHHQQQHPHQYQQQYFQEEYFVRDPEQIVVPHQKAAHILGQVCPGCLTSAPSNSSSTGSINDATNTSSGHFSPHNQMDDLNSSLLSIAASPSSGGNSSSSTTSSTASSTGATNVPCLIPYIVTRLCGYIENSGGMIQEGLFRISGNAKLVEKLKQSFDQSGDAPLESEGDLASAAALLKQFLRELPQPLIPNGSQFLDVIRSLKNDRETCVLSLKALVSQLPDENYYTLRYLIRFLHRISQRNEENRMTSTNLGIVFAPNIFRVCVDTYQGLKDQSAANELVNLLISDYCEIFNESHCHGQEPDGSLVDISCSSESQCPCSMNTETEVKSPNYPSDQLRRNFENLVFTIEESSDDQHNPSTSSLNKLDPDSPNQEMRLKLDRKRKSFQINKIHRTIDEFNDDDDDGEDEQRRYFKSFDFERNSSQSLQQPPQQQQQQVHHRHYQNHSRSPQRCNSEEVYSRKEYIQSSSSASMIKSTIGITSSSSSSISSTNRFGLKTTNNNNNNHNDSYRKNSHSHEIIITNSSDSVSTDDNTTTATSTGPTVCSVIIGVDKLDVCNANQSADVTDVSEDNFVKTVPDYSKLLTCDLSEMKGARSSSCGSDCTENINVPASLSFASDEDDDSLLKSIASECSDNGSTNSSSSSSSSSNNSGSGDDPAAGSTIKVQQTDEAEPEVPEKPDSGPDPNPDQKQSNEEEGNEKTKTISPNKNNDNKNNADYNHLLQNKPWLSTSAEDAKLVAQPFRPRSKHVNSGDETTQDDDTESHVNIMVESEENEEAMISALVRPPYEQGTTKMLDEIAHYKDIIQPSLKLVDEDHLRRSAKTEDKDLNRTRNRRLQSIRRKLKQFETNFEQENGFRATFDNKMSSSFARPLMLELRSLLQVTETNKDLDQESLDLMKFDDDSEKKSETSSPNSMNMMAHTHHQQYYHSARNQAWRYNPNNPHVYTTQDIFNTIFGNSSEQNLARISEMMQEIQRTLVEKRIIAQRPESLDSMTTEQIFDEKLALQKALLRFEALCGRPESKAQRDIVRPVYDRYRLVKRCAAKIISSKNQKQDQQQQQPELQPILEHVQMNFKSPKHQPPLSSDTGVPDDGDGGSSIVLDIKPEPEPQERETRQVERDITAAAFVRDDDGMAFPNFCDNFVAKDKNFHIMSRHELLENLHEYHQQKRNLRSVLRTFENDFLKKTGRRVEKEDRSNMSSVYTCYKNTKGKIKLIEALISKKVPKK